MSFPGQFSIADLLGDVRQWLADLEPDRWDNGEFLETEVRNECASFEKPFAIVCSLLRLSLVGRQHSEPIFNVCSILGRDETLRRLEFQMPAERIASLRRVERDMKEWGCDLSPR